LAEALAKTLAETLRRGAAGCLIRSRGELTGHRHGPNYDDGRPLNIGGIS
jgi:hypothetical protein